MEVRCSSCKKLFRVSDDKITGSGVKFACTRCHETVKITSADFEQYKLSGNPAPNPAPAIEPAALRAAPTATAVAHAGMQEFDLSDPATAAAAIRAEEKFQPEFSTSENGGPTAPAPVPANTIQKSQTAAPTEPTSKKAPAIEAKIQEQASSASKPERVIPAGLKHEPAAPPVAPVAPVKSAPTAAGSGKQPAAPSASKPEHVIPPGPRREPIASSDEPEAPVKSASIAAGAFKQPDAASGAGRKIAVLFILVLIIGAAAFGVKFYLDNASQKASEAVKQMTPDGLVVQTASGVIDQENGDLVITGAVDNTTDKPKAAWFIMAEVYDANTNVLTRAKLLNGKQLYTRRDYEIMAQRGIEIQQLKQTLLQEQGVIIPPRGTASFEIRVMQPPVGVASFNATLQPFDPVQLFKEMAEEQK